MKKRTSTFTEKDVDLVLSWLKGDITMAAVQKKLGDVPSPTIYITLARALKQAYGSGNIVINFRNIV